jgi:hypothetical protein
MRSAIFLFQVGYRTDAIQYLWLHVCQMAREHWIENLMCRHCSTEGIAVLSTDDKFSWNVQVETVPKGFGFTRTEHGSNFYCSACHRAVEP